MPTLSNRLPVLLVWGVPLALAAAALGAAQGKPVPNGADPTAGAMAAAASRFLATLTAQQRQAASFPFDSEERLNWQFRRSRERKGLPLRDLTPAQTAAA